MKTILSALLLLPLLASAADSNWGTYLGDNASSHYSTLKQITPRNVAKLEVAWTYRAGGMDTNNRSQIQCNPLVIGGVLYGTTPDLQVVALNAATGAELWRFDRDSTPVPLDNFWNKTCETALTDLRAANNPTTGTPASLSDVELAVDAYFPNTIPSVAPALSGRAAHPSGRNRLMLDLSASFWRDSRLSANN